MKVKLAIKNKKIFLFIIKIQNINHKVEAKTNFLIIKMYVCDVCKFQSWGKYFQ